ncbi:energy-coupling factor transporter transmembrane component T [Halodesulfovibrio marinisediminis]|uniref:Biotin transport system permease protein n=1 Tax=Halodesulfovibrio marinisediminis DSM 17456 TaxID=1121457 RepID=A0A1N6H1S3_9BACT|nr:energy-coupling factor transporter transmembrane component T [Halodesulfovibrio marinisediminis]SIO13744.1 biotin transport system permease protein [Halodesulfovibrio marinisediminis DSM 17456]
MKTFSLSSFDPRLKIILAATIGILTWHVPVYALSAYAGFILILGITNRVHIALGRRAIATYIYFIIVWAGIKFALDCTSLIQGIAPDYQGALQAAGVLALRLTILIGIGILLATTSSARQLGLALSWFLRPILGKRSWEPALSLALMIHFIPLIQRTFSQVLQAITLRNPPRSKWQQFLLVPQAVLRICAQKTWTQTVAVAARKLDSPAAWSTSLPFRFSEVIISLCILLAVFSPIILNHI